MEESYACRVNGLMNSIPYWLFYSRDNIFMNFTKKEAFRENIIVNSCAIVALLHLKQRVRESKIANIQKIAIREILIP